MVNNPCYTKWSMYVLSVKLEELELQGQKTDLQTLSELLH